MALMPGLQINMGQQLKLTPQLQQSIKILQYSALEVQQTISTTLETNFMLDIADDQIDDEEAKQEEVVEAKEDQPSQDKSEQPLNLEKESSLSEELEVDCSWDEIYTDMPSPGSQGSQSLDDYVSAESYTASVQSLQDKLYWQSDIYQWKDHQELIASYLIDDINDDGYLIESLEDILTSINTKEPELNISLTNLETVLKIIQTFEPTGVGAQDLQECLLLQLEPLPKTPYIVTATQLVKDNFDWLSLQDYKRIQKAYALDEEDLEKVMRIIQSLDPRPGRIYASIEADIIIPDLKLSHSQQGYILELNPDAFPRLTINSEYIDMASSLTDSEESKKIKDQLIEAKGLIKSLHSRGETLLRVGRYIVEKQAQFFEKGEHFMQPMVLRDVAEVLDLHESTISRATNQKYMQTPRGTFELKYFFSTGVVQYGSEDQSAISIKAYIKELIAEENPKKPLSDNKLMVLLEEKDISVARRTIAKYREAMGIPSSSDRKKLNKFK